MTTRNKKVHVSKYNDLSNIYDINNGRLFKTLRVPNFYYNSKAKKIQRIVYLNTVKNYSLLGMTYGNIFDDFNKKAILIKLRSGVVALRIPYVKLFRFYKE